MSRKLYDEEFLDYVSSYDILLFCETWISKKHLFNLEMNGYKSFHLYGNNLVVLRKDAIAEDYPFISKQNIVQESQLLKLTSMVLFG